ncbi:MAG: class I SAM-dependent methyltransferase, partial [Pseudomonadota bacterium]
MSSQNSPRKSKSDMDTSSSSRRTPTDEEYCHERLGRQFDTALSSYDTQQRVRTLVDSFLTDSMVAGKSYLDVGCGLGFFSQRLAERGADVLACDLGPSLVEETHRRTGCRAVVADALSLVEQFGDGAFDGIVSSECIEHTPDPALALRQMVRVVKRGGLLSISTPNIVWYPVVKMATILRIRPFDGHENFSSWKSLRAVLQDSGAEIIREQGLHLFPFQFRMHGLSSWCDRHLQP